MVRGETPFDYPQQIAEAMGWAPRTVRGFLASLAKKGIKVEVLERVRQVAAINTGLKN